eukprot:6487110-Amphidinium_carterae.1
MAGMMHLLLLPVFDPFAKFSVVDHISDLPGGRKRSETAHGKKESDFQPQSCRETLCAHGA